MLDWVRNDAGWIDVLLSGLFGHDIKQVYSEGKSTQSDVPSTPPLHFTFLNR